jgi:hypothetical protein
MKVDMSNPASVAAWYRVNPQRHAEFLRHCLRSEAWREFWPAIEASRELLREAA